MSNRRRHAHDLIDSLNSFRQTISQEELSQTRSKTSSENRLDFVRNDGSRDDRNTCSRNNMSRAASIILAGSSTSQQFIPLPCNIAEENCNNKHTLSKEDIVSVSNEALCLSIKPDLNKCINLFDNEYLSKECDALQEQLNIALPKTIVREDINSYHLNKIKTKGQQDPSNHQRSMSTESLRNIISLNEKLKRSKSCTVLDRALKRDTNYNIKGDQLSLPIKSATKVSHNDKIETLVSAFDALSLSKPALVSRKDDSVKDQLDSVNSEINSKDEINPSELKTLLHSLTDQKPLKETAIQQRLLRRLSTNYYDSPKVFTEGLLTIIEESVINHDSCLPLQYLEVSLCKFNEELQKISKFIEDETIPEWPQSPGMSTSICAKRKSQESDLLRKSLCAFALSPNKALNLTPSRCNIKSPKRAYRRMSKNASTVKSLHDSTKTFESLEAMCKKLYPDSPSNFPIREEDRSESPLQDMDGIWRTCESQMASLEDSPDIHKQIKKAGTYTSDSVYRHNQTPEAQNLQYELSNEKYDRTDLKRVSDTLKQQTERNKCQEVIKLDDLESTLMYEIAKKRQRCFDTAKVMMEIDANLESTEETYPNVLITAPSPVRTDDKFMKTLICVKTYQDYLEKHVSLLNLLHRAKLSSPRTPRDKKDVRAKKICNENVNTCTLSTLLGDKPTLRSPRLSPRKKSTSSATKHHPTSKTVFSKPRLFVTPGKTPVNKSCKPKRTYFPSLLPGMNKTNKSNISPQAKNIYRQIGSYDHVVSPVAMYIKGTESHLIKNPRSKTAELTERKRTPQSANSKMKFQPSLKKKPTGTAIGDENVADNFLHPKMHHKFSTHSRAITEAENEKVGKCVNVLLRSTQDKVVIRYEGGTKSVQTDHLE